MKMGEERTITVPLIRPLTNKPIGSLILTVRNQVRFSTYYQPLAWGQPAQPWPHETSSPVQQ